MPVFRKFPAKNAKPLRPAAAEVRRMMFSFRKPIKRDLPFPLNNPYVLLAVMFFGSVLFLVVLAAMFSPKAMTGTFVSISGGKDAKPTYMAIGKDGHLLRSTESKQEWSAILKKNIGAISPQNNKKECITRTGWSNVEMRPCGGADQKWLVDFSRNILRAVDDKSGKPKDECLSSAYSQMNHGAMITVHECSKGKALVPEDQKFKFKSGHFLKSAIKS